VLGWDKNTLFCLLLFVYSYKTDIWVRLQFLFPFAILFCLRKGQRRLPLKFFTLVLMQFRKSACGILPARESGTCIKDKSC